MPATANWRFNNRPAANYGCSAVNIPIIPHSALMLREQLLISPDELNIKASKLLSQPQRLVFLLKKNI